MFSRLCLQEFNIKTVHVLLDNSHFSLYKICGFMVFSLCRNAPNLGRAFAMAIMRDRARRASVFPRTVSIVINGKGSAPAQRAPEIRGTRKAADYQPNQGARRQKVRQAPTRGVLAGDVTRWFLTRVTRSINGEARIHGPAVILGGSLIGNIKQGRYLYGCCRRQGPVFPRGWLDPPPMPFRSWREDIILVAKK